MGILRRPQKHNLIPMKITTLPILATALVCGGASTMAANSEDATAAEAKPYHPLSLRLEAGTTGAGGAVGWRFWNHLGLRAGSDYFQYTASETIEDINYSAKLRTLSEPVLLEWYPWSKHSFHVSAGVAFNQNRLTGTATPSGNITIGNNTYTPSQVGTLDLKVEQQPVNGYLSIGGNFFYFDKAHHWALGGELGVMYTGTPRVSLSTSGSGVSPADLESERQQITDKIEDYKFWPVLKLAVTCSF